MFPRPPGAVPRTKVQILAYDRAMHWTAAEIRRRRELAGLKQSELADRIGASRRTVAAWEGGENTPSGRWIPKLEEVIGDAALPRPGGGPRPVLLDEADLGQTIGRLVTIYREMIGGRLPFDLEPGLLTRGEQDAHDLHEGGRVDGESEPPKV